MSVTQLSTAPGASMGEPLLSIRGLRVGFRRGGAQFEAVRGIDLDVARGEVVGIVGESGSGKSVGMLAALGLASSNAIVTGSVRFKGEELVGKPAREMRTIRGARITMIFQDPLSSLNPVMTVGAQIAEAIRLHQRLTRKQAMARAVELLSLVAIPQPERRVHQYPHEFSGGMRQRAVITMAVANDPDLLIADEPTRPSTSPSRRRFCRCCARCRRGWVSASSSSPTISASSPATPTGWPSSIPAASSNRRR